MKILIVYLKNKPAEHSPSKGVEFFYWRYLDDFDKLIGKTFDAVVMEFEASQDPRINQFVRDKVKSASNKT